jgi:hypothetical protein
MSALSDFLAMTPPVRRRRLTQAAGIATAVLVCHPETWAEIQALAGALQPKRAINGTPGTKADDGLVEVALSGVALATLMQAMHEVRSATDAGDVPFTRRFPPHDRAVARRVYLAAAKVVQRVASEPGTVPPRIVLDDRMPS